jgi:crotonobetainyl-CoA:carnitine CoA-transferase CaiB-like acyl-CoA transferase
LVVCNVSGYGTAGPYASKKAYDLLVQSEVGVTSITGTTDTPSRVGISIADIAAGMYAYTGVLTALLARKDTGTGTTVDVSLFDALAEWMSFPVYYTAYSGSELPRSGPNHPSIAPYGPFRSADGRQVYLAVQNPREWPRFCGDVLQRAALADDERFRTNDLRVLNRPALHALINDVFARRRSDHRQGLRPRIAYSRMNSVAEFINHPASTSRGRWRK